MSEGKSAFFRLQGRGLHLIYDKKASSVSIRPGNRAKLATRIGQRSAAADCALRRRSMTKTLTALAVAATLAAATLSVPSAAYADNGRITAGVLGGLAAGALIGGAIASRPAYPAYVVGGPAV